MLTHLQIRDFAIVAAVEIEFGTGLTVLTGETGAGKSIVVDALAVIAGGRAGADVIRHGAERAEICATFDIRRTSCDLRDLLEEQSIEVEGELLVRRVIAADGRSRAYLNGQAVPVQLLRDVVGQLVDIHGQHEFQSLVRPPMQRALLDEFGRLQSMGGQVQAAHRVWLALLNKLLEIESQVRDRDARLELLRYQCQELGALSLQPGEIAELSVERARLGNRGRLASGAQAAVQSLYEADEGSAHASLSHAIAALRPLAEVDPQLAALLPPLEEAAIRIAEAARELGRYADALDLDSARQEQVERRLAAIEELARKHRVRAEELIDRGAVLANELAALERADTDLATLRVRHASAQADYQGLAARLSAQRTTTARTLAKDITSRMQTLGMTGGRFQADVTPHASAEPQPHGLDQIEFRVSANPGQPLRPVTKVASGGELARLSLAVQVASTAQELRCMVFDEVDAGVGGAVAEIVGRELRSLGERSQVLCVTHLPQVASQGHQHLRVFKLTDGRNTRTGVAKLIGEDRVNELARMLGGVEVTTRAREHASEMLARAAAQTPSTGTEHAPRSSGRRKG
ncbi:MAG: DNA repair protein RecN [Steroidobacteraceae bacterium]